MPIHNQFVFGPNNQFSSAALRALGAFFPIEVHVPPLVAQAMVAAGQPVPACATGIGLVDTGATLTCVNDSVLRGLGLNPIGVTTSGTANGPSQCNLYPARIVFPIQGWTVDIGQVIGVNLAGQQVATTPPQPIIALLGRNFLERGVLVYNGPGAFWTLAMA